MRTRIFIGCAALAIGLFAHAIQPAEAHPPGSNTQNCSGPGRDCEGYNARFKRLYTGALVVDGGTGFSGGYLNAGASFDGGVDAPSFTCHNWDAGTCIAVRTNGRVYLNWPTNTIYAVYNGSSVKVVGAGVLVDDFQSIGWTSGGVGLISTGTTNGLTQNSFGASTGNTQPWLGGTLAHDMTSTGNVSNTETTLYTYTVKANTLNVNGRGVRLTAAGTFAGNANTKTVKLKYGGTDLTSGTFSGAFNACFWRLQAEVFRTAASAQIALPIFYVDCGATDSTIINNGSAVASNASDAILLLTGTSSAASSNDIVVLYNYLEVLP